VATKNVSRAQGALQQGLALHQTGRLAEAQDLYKRALKWQPRNFDALHLLGLIEFQTGNVGEAVALIARAVSIDPRNSIAYNNLGCARAGLKEDRAAIADYDQAIALNPNYADAYNNRGNSLHALGQYTNALASYDRAIALKPDFADAYYSRGVTLADLKRYENAIASYERAVALNSAYAVAFNNRGVALAALERYEAAVGSYDQALAVNGDYADAHNNRGSALYRLQRYEEAIASYERAIALQPQFPVAYNNLGAALAELKCLDAAIAAYERAIAQSPDYAEVYNSRGAALAELKQFEAAITSFERAIALGANSPIPYNGRANALLELMRFDSAIASYDQAIAADPEYADAHYNRGIALWKLGRHEAAVVSYERAMALKPTIRFMYGMRLLSEMQLCDWSTRERDLQQLRSLIERSEPASGPFAVLVAADEPALQLRSAQILVRELFAPDPSLGAIAPRPRHERIRVGYFSADFHNHATLHLMAGLFEAHDRSRFECTAFSFGAPSQDGMRARLLAASEHFLDVREKSDRQIAQLARELQVDIAVDLKGFTEGHRTGIFALRAAPLQLSYLGYPGTMGAPYIDYLIADRTLVPEHSQHHYSEKIIYLPDSYQINDSQRPIAPRTLSRAQCALPPTGFVFCCFNNCYKITPSTFDCWMRLLSGVQGSVLWLLEDNAVATRNLKREASSRGVDPDRLLFAPRLPLPEHLARHSLADLFLDTLPCNAHTTASDALWAALPVLSCPGEGFAARVAASVLHALDLPELIASSPQHYEQLALELALNPERLALIRQRLAAQRLSSPLFNTLLTTRHIESAYSLIYERYLASYPTDHIVGERSL
jgi:protein O-GlcNAc transferase